MMLNFEVVQIKFCMEVYYTLEMPGNICRAQDASSTSLS